MVGGKLLHLMIVYIYWSTESTETQQATSVPCEQLFSAGAGIATDQCSRLRSDRFEELQVMKHTWCKLIMDHTAENSSQVEEVWLDHFKELYQIDEDLAKNDKIPAGTSVETVELWYLCSVEFLDWSWLVLKNLMLCVTERDQDQCNYELWKTETKRPILTQ